MEKIYLKREKKIRARPHLLYLGRANAFGLREKNRFLLRPRDVALESVFIHIPPCSRVYKI